MSRIYLDHAATTPVDPEVVRSMEPYHTLQFGNASSVHSFGQAARAGVDYAKSVLARFLGCHEKEVLFTSGATESNNIALRGLIAAFTSHSPNRNLHIVTSTIEHPSVLESARVLEREGVRVTYIPVDESGVLSVQQVANAISDDTILVSVMYVNNEVGTLQPIRDIGKLVEKINEARGTAKAKKRLSSKLEPFERLYFHTDAVQAAQFFPMNVDHLHVDLMTLSAHKIYGPKGAGALYVREGVPLASLMFGGAQEYGIRPGTYNVPAIVGFGKAVELLLSKKNKDSILKIQELRNKLLQLLREKIPSIEVNGDIERRAPNNVNISIPGLDGESALIALDLAGIAVSTGAACASASIEPSHVLQAMGYPDARCRGSLRITLGLQSTDEHLQQFVDALAHIVLK